MMCFTKNLTAALLFPLALAACGDKATTSDAQPQPPQQQSTTLGDNSRNAIDWTGRYEGILPCASCEGIKTVLELSNDGTYRLETQYLGEADAKIIEERGYFSWNRDGSAITLEENGAQYQVGENQLFMLDKEGKRITGELAPHYRLLKGALDLPF